MARLCGFNLTKQKEVHSIVVREYTAEANLFGIQAHHFVFDKENFRRRRRGSEQQGRAGRNVWVVQKRTNYNQLETRTLFSGYHGV